MAFMPKTTPQVLLALAIVGLLGGASVPDMIGAYKGFVGQPNVVVDTTPYDSLDIRLDAVEADSKKKANY